MWTVKAAQSSSAVDRELDRANQHTTKRAHSFLAFTAEKLRWKNSSISKHDSTSEHVTVPLADALTAQTVSRTDGLLQRWIQQSDAVIQDLESTSDSSHTLNGFVPERRKSANHTDEQAINALKSAGITVDSCVTELAAPAKTSVADEELVSDTLQQIEDLLNGLAAKAPPGPYTERRLAALTGTRMWLPTMLAASKQGISLTMRPEDDPNQRQAWLGPGKGPRYKSAAEREAAQRIRQETLAAGRTPNSAALERALGRTTMEETDERLSGTFSSSSASTDLPPLNSEMQADAVRIAAIIAGEDSNSRQSRGGTSTTSDAPFTVDTSPINSTLPSLDGVLEFRASDAHTEVSEGPPDPPSMNGAAIYDLLHASLPTVKEEELTGSTSGTVGGNTGSLRTSNSQLRSLHAMAAPAAMQTHVQTVAEASEDALHPQPQAPVESKFSASGFGASYMTTSPVHSAVLGSIPSSSVPALAPSQQDSVGMMKSLTGPPPGMMLTGISSMGPEASMLSGNMSPTAGPVSSTTAGPISDPASLATDPGVHYTPSDANTVPRAGKIADSEFNSPHEPLPHGKAPVTNTHSSLPGPDSIGPYPERQPSSSVAPSVSVPLEAGPSSLSRAPSQPVIHYIDRLPSAVADIEFERQPTSQGTSRSPNALATNSAKYNVPSPPISSNAGTGGIMRSTGSGQGQGRNFGPTSFVGVIHDTMSSLNESIFGTILNTARTQDSANLADIDADNTAALNDPTAVLDPLQDDGHPEDSSQMVSNPLAVISPISPSLHAVEDVRDLYTNHNHDKDNSRFTDSNAGPKQSLSFASAGDVEEVTAAFVSDRSMGRVRSQQKLAAESSKHSAAGSHVGGDMGDQEQFTSVHTGQEPSAMSVDSTHLDGDSLLVAPNSGTGYTASSRTGSAPNSRSVSFVSQPAARSAGSAMQYATDYPASLAHTDAASAHNTPAASQIGSHVAGGGSTMSHMQGGLSQYASDIGGDSSMVGGLVNISAVNQHAGARSSLGGLSQYASEVGGWGGSTRAGSGGGGIAHGGSSTAGDREPAFMTAQEEPSTGGGMNYYCAEPEPSMLSSLDGSRMEGEPLNDSRFLADAAPAGSNTDAGGPHRQRHGGGGNRAAIANPLGGPGSHLSSIMEGSQGEVTMSVSAWAQKTSATQDDCKLDSAFGQPDGGSVCSSAQDLAAGESLLSESAAIVPSRTAAKSRSRSSLHVAKGGAYGVLGNSGTVPGATGAHSGALEATGRLTDSQRIRTRSHASENYNTEQSRTALQPNSVGMPVTMGDNISVLDAPSPPQTQPSSTQSAATAAAQQPGGPLHLPQQKKGSARSSRIPRPSSLSSADEFTHRATRGSDAPPKAPATASRRLTDLFLPTSPSFAGDRSGGSSALDSATSGMDADISAALEEESRMEFTGDVSRTAAVSHHHKHPPGTRTSRPQTGRVAHASITTKHTPNTTPGNSVASVSALVSTPSLNDDGSEPKINTQSHQESPRFGGCRGQTHNVSSDNSGSFCDPEGVTPREGAPISAVQNTPSRTGRSSSGAQPTLVRTGGSISSASGASGPSYALRKLGSSSPATAATDPPSAFHDSLQPPPTPDKSPVPLASTAGTSRIRSPSPAGSAPSKQPSGKLATYAQTAGLASTALKSIRKKSHTITYLSDEQPQQGTEGVARRPNSKTLSAHEMARLEGAITGAQSIEDVAGVTQTAPVVHARQASGTVEGTLATKGGSAVDDQSNCHSEMSQLLLEQRDVFATADSAARDNQTMRSHPTATANAHATVYGTAPNIDSTLKGTSSAVSGGRDTASSHLVAPSGNIGSIAGGATGGINGGHRVTATPSRTGSRDSMTNRLRHELTNELSANSVGSVALERKPSRRQSHGHASNSGAAYTSMPLKNGHSMSTSITQGPPDLAAIAAAAAAAADSRSVVSGRIASNIPLEAIPRPLLASPTKKSSTLESTISTNNFTDSKPHLVDTKRSPKAVTLSDVDVQVDHVHPRGLACCFLPLCFKK